MLCFEKHGSLCYLYDSCFVCICFSISIDITHLQTDGDEDPDDPDYEPSVLISAVL